MDELLRRYPVLSNCRGEIEHTVTLLLNCFKSGGKLLVCGNGGSCSDSEHIVGELMKGFLLKREVPEPFKKNIREIFPENGEYIATHLQGALPAISLTSQMAVLSAFINDVAADMMYAQLVYGYAKPGDVFLGLSTSGHSKNILNAARVAKACGLPVIGLTGKNHSELDLFADAVIHVPETETYRVQELHLPVYHYLCAACEKEIFG